MKRAVTILFLLFGIAAPSPGQTAAELDLKYPVVKGYEVRPGILMTAEYDAEGQACEMTIERRTTTRTKTIMNLGSPLSKELEKELVDELAPPSERGKELTGFENWFGSVTIDGPFIITKYNYENVVVEVSGIQRDSGPSGDMVLTISWRKRVCSQEVQPSAASLH